MTKEFWLVYDFGGGTFDAAIMKAEDGSISVVNHGGDNYLGGSDIDWAVVEKLIIPDVIAQHNFPALARGNKRWRGTLARIKNHVESAKIQLSRSDSAFVECKLKDAKIFRRRLRRDSPERRFALDDSERLRRSSAAKRVFADAEHFAQLGASVVYPVHLLYATLLAEDKHRDATLAELEIEKKRLVSVAKREVVIPQLGSASASKKARTRWN